MYVHTDNQKDIKSTTCYYNTLSYSIPINKPKQLEFQVLSPPIQMLSHGSIRSIQYDIREQVPIQSMIQQSSRG